MSLNQKLSAISTIPKDTLDKLSNLSIACICDDIAAQKNSDCISTDIGIGTLNIAIVDDSLHFRFIPNKLFESQLIDVLQNNQNPLLKNLETSLANKFTQLYKELL